MIDFNSCDPRLLDDVDIVVDDLTKKVGLDPDRILLVGAACRDVLHSALGHDFQVRATRDTDLAIALTDWSSFERIEANYRRWGDSGIGFTVAGIRVDVLPFGSIEEPEGITTPARRGEELVVFGFGDVYDQAGDLQLPGGKKIRIPYPAGYGALKMRAWIDRSSAGEYKDAGDIACVLFWYQEWDDVMNRLWDSEDRGQVAEELEFDMGRAAARILGEDIRAQLSATNCTDLAARWELSNLDRLAGLLAMPAGVVWPQNRDRRRDLITELTAGVRLPD